MAAEDLTNSPHSPETDPIAPDRIEQAQQDLAIGQRAFESGQYRTAVEAFERSRQVLAPNSLFHGEVTIWLITAYEAVDDRERAQNLCQITTKHPQWDTRKDAKRLLYVLKAPVLRRREDWQTKIPDLENLEPKTDGQKWAAPKNPGVRPPRPAPPPKGYQIAPPTDPTQVETEDRGFIWVALGTIGLVMAGLTWFGLNG
jgi:hypothetical protein